MMCLISEALIKQSKCQSSCLHFSSLMIEGGGILAGTLYRYVHWLHQTVQDG